MTSLRVHETTSLEEALAILRKYGVTMSSRVASSATPTPTGLQKFEDGLLPCSGRTIVHTGCRLRNRGTS
jgi:hypothetical protein